MRAEATALALLAALLAAPGAVLGEEPGARVLLRWQAIPGASGYDLQVARDPAFAKRELEVRVELAGYRLGSSSDVRRYWRVRSVDAEGRPGPWSAAKTIEPIGAPPPPDLVAPAPPPLLDVPPLPPHPVAAPSPAPAEPRAVLALGAPAAGELKTRKPPRDEGIEGAPLGDLLRRGRPALLAGWRSNLLGVGAFTITAEGEWPLDGLGPRWSGALRAGWWRAGATVPAALGMDSPVDATADVFPAAVLLSRAFDLTWASAWAGAGLGADLVVIRLRGQGSLDATLAAQLVAGAGRRLGHGEAFAELGGSLGGVDGPLGRLRTGGISLSLGYRLGR